MSRVVLLILGCAILLAPVLCTCSMVAVADSRPTKRTCCSKPQPHRSSDAPRSHCSHCNQDPQMRAPQANSYIAAPCGQKILYPSHIDSSLNPAQLCGEMCNPPIVLLDLFHSSCLLTV